MDLKPIKTRKIYEEIVEQIKQLISQGHLQAGDRLPSEREMAERLHVSRASVREAFSALEMVGVLEVRSGEGTYIRHANFEDLGAPLGWLMAMEKDMVFQLLEVRKIMEVQAVGLATERTDTSDLKELEAALDDMRQDLETERLGEAADHRFHYALAQATHNKILIRIMNTISDTMRQTLKTSRIKLYQSEGRPDKLLREHEGIYQAVKARDTDKAKKLMLDHLVGVEEDMTRNF